MAKQKKAFYAAPGADDTYLRPGTGGAFAPREIAVMQKDGALWSAWVHRKNGKEFLSASIKKPGLREILLTVDENPDFFSKPAFINFPGDAPLLLCAVCFKNRREIRSYRFSGRSWSLEDKIPVAGAVYHMDAVSTGDGGAWLAYAAVTENNPGPGILTRKFKDGVWEDEIHHPFKSRSLNRPKLAAGKDGKIFLAADAYTPEGFRIIFKTLNGDKSATWETVSDKPGWHLFPSLAVDAEDIPWLAWLFQRPVKRDGLIGLDQKAFAARLPSGKWEKVPDGEFAADLNFGLLPIKRYFGYAGLRRYPRLAAFSGGSMALAWEQQRDEQEIWDNVENGFFCGRLYKDGRWQKPVILHNGGSCHTFDSKILHDENKFMIAVKGEHRPDGNDFFMAEADFREAKVYRPKPKNLWRGWKPYALPEKKITRTVVRKKNKPALKLYWADLHCHSVFSPDAEGEPDEQYFFARDLAKIDAVCIADNDFYPDKMLLDSEINYTGKLAESLSRKGKFLALSGYEWTYHRADKERTFNHRIVIYPAKNKETARRNESAGKSASAFSRYLEETKYFNFPHHAYWKLLEAPGEDCVEVTSAWGTYILDSNTVADALNSGRHFGFLGNSDSHRFMPGLSGALTGIYAEELSREAVMEALRKRRTFATAGNRTALRFSLNGAFMGEETITKEKPGIHWKVFPEGELEYIEIIRNGKAIYTSDKKEGGWKDSDIPPGVNWYCLQAKEKGRQERLPHNLSPAKGKYAWSSPIWVEFG